MLEPIRFRTFHVFVDAELCFSLIWNMKDIEFPRTPICPDVSYWCAKSSFRKSDMYVHMVRHIHVFANNFYKVYRLDFVC